MISSSDLNLQIGKSGEPRPIHALDLVSAFQHASGRADDDAVLRVSRGERIGSRAAHAAVRLAKSVDDLLAGHERVDATPLRWRTQIVHGSVHRVGQTRDSSGNGGRSGSEERDEIRGLLPA